MRALPFPLAPRIALALAAAFGAASLAAPAAAQNVDIQPSGIQVGFPGTNCSVYYDRRGRFRSARPGCNPGLVQRADAAVAQRVRPNYGPGPGGGHGNAPRVFVARNGAGQVVYPRGRCTVRYAANGRHLVGRTACSRAQVRAADRLYRQERARRGFR
jgi:hypothetical protein